MGGRRVATALLLALAFASVGGPALDAHVAPGPVVHAEAWAWLAQREGVPGMGLASGIRADQLPVAWLGQDEKLTFLEFEPLPSVTGLTMTVAIDESGPNRSIHEADLLACAVTEAWEADSPMAWEKAPERACETAPRGVYQPATSDFFFDLTVLLPQLRSSGTHGIALVPDPMTESTNFQVVFHAAAARGIHLVSSGPQTERPSEDTGAPSQAAGADAEVPPVAPSVSGEASSPLLEFGPSADAAAAPEAAEPATRSLVSPGDVRSTSRDDNETQRPSFGGFYVGLVAVAVLLVCRPLLGVLMQTKSQPTANLRTPGLTFGWREGRS